MSAGETIAVPRCVFVGNSTFVNYPIALETSLSVVLLVASDANDLLIPRDETFASDWLLADTAAEALFMPLLRLVLELLHTCSEDVTTSVTLGREVDVVAIGAVETFVFCGKRSVG